MCITTIAAFVTASTLQQQKLQKKDDSMRESATATLRTFPTLTPTEAEMLRVLITTSGTLTTRVDKEMTITVAAAAAEPVKKDGDNEAVTHSCCIQY